MFNIRKTDTRERDFNLEQRYCNDVINMPDFSTEEKVIACYTRQNIIEERLKLRKDLLEGYWN